MNIVVDKIIEVLRENLGQARGIKRFFLGEPIELAQSDLPCIFVQVLNKRIEQLDNVNDLITAEILVGICVDIDKYIAREVNEGAGERFLLEIEGGRNTNGTPITTSVTYVMRNNFTLENTVVHQESNTVWGEREVTGGVAREVHLYFTVKVKIKNKS